MNQNPQAQTAEAATDLAASMRELNRQAAEQSAKDAAERDMRARDNMAFSLAMEWAKKHEPIDFEDPRVTKEIVDHAFDFAEQFVVRMNKK